MSDLYLFLLFEQRSELKGPVRCRDDSLTTSFSIDDNPESCPLY